MVLTAACGGDGRYADENAVRDYASDFVARDTTETGRRFAAKLGDVVAADDATADSVYRFVHMLARELLSSGRHMDAIELLSGVEDILARSGSDELRDRRMLIVTYVCLGAAHAETGMPGIGLDYYSRGLDLARDTIFDDRKAMLLNNIAVLYHTSGHFDKAEQYYRRALDINLRRHCNDEIYLNYSNLAELYHQSGDNKKALDTSLRGMQYADASRNPQYFYTSHIFLGGLYTERGQLDIASSYLENALANMRRINFVPGIIEAYQAYSECFIAKGMPDSAVIYARRALDLSRSSDLHPSENRSLKALAHSYAAEDRDREAVELLMRSAELDDSLRNCENRQRLVEWETRASLGQTAPTSSAVSSTVGIIAIIVAALLLVALVAILLIYRRRRHASEAEIQRLADTADGLRRRLMAESLDRIKTREGLTGVCEEMREVLADSTFKSDQGVRARHLLAKLNGMAEGVTDEFTLSMGEVHPDFYRALEERFPTLTLRDRRLCGFLYLGMSNREIAAHTGREVRSVESARNRLRKKLGLDLNADLEDFLRKL